MVNLKRDALRKGQIRNVGSENQSVYLQNQFSKELIQQDLKTI